MQIFSVDPLRDEAIDYIVKTASVGIFQHRPGLASRPFAPLIQGEFGCNAACLVGEEDRGRAARLPGPAEAQI
jgi:hypothetical protein